MVLVAGCATPQPPAWLGLGSGPVYRLGAVTVEVRSQPEVERRCVTLGARAQRGRIQGCYHAASGTIYTVPDVWVLLHEWRHHEEGAWH